MDNYIVINGKKAELTKEQLKALGIEYELERNNPFGKITDKSYYYIANTDVINFTQNIDTIIDEDMYNSVNYFNDEDFANQVMLHQKLYRKLLKYAYDNYDNYDFEWWGCNNRTYYYIFFDYLDSVFSIASVVIKYKNQGTVYFPKQEVAENAIEDVVKPFMEEHPEFVW